MEESCSTSMSSLNKGNASLSMLNRKYQSAFYSLLQLCSTIIMNHTLSVPGSTLPPEEASWCPNCVQRMCANVQRDPAIQYKIHSEDVQV